MPSAVTAAAWEPQSSTFFLLRAAQAEICTLDTTQSPLAVECTIDLSGAGTLEPRAFAIGDGELFVADNDEVRRYELDGSAKAPVALVTEASDEVSMAWAEGALLIGVRGSDDSPHVLADGDDTLSQPFTDAINPSRVTSDRSVFAFKVPAGPNFDVWRLGSDWAGASCDSVTVGQGVTVAGERVAWVDGFPGAFALHWATFGPGCQAESVAIDDGLDNLRAVALAHDRALVSTSYNGNPPSVGFELYDLSRAPAVTVGAGLPGVTFDGFYAHGVVMGEGYALVVSDSLGMTPLLIQL
jgi:hypothetical protein